MNMDSFVSIPINFPPIRPADWESWWKVWNQNASFMKKNSGYLPYGKYELYSQGSNLWFIQSFVKYDSQLSDKFLEILITELQHIPGFGSAYLQAEENYKKELELAKSTEAKLRKFIELLNVKNEKGVMAAANLVRQPQQELLAESKPVSPYENVPKKDLIAESKNKPLNNFFAKPLKLDMNSNKFVFAICVICVNFESLK